MVDTEFVIPTWLRQYGVDSLERIGLFRREDSSDSEEECLAIYSDA
jgi:hypothetical protein